MSGTRCIQNREQSPTETRNHAVDFSGKIEPNELLTGTPTLSVSPTTSPVLATASPQVNTTIRKINGKLCAPGKAVLFRASGGTSGTAYVITASCVTDSSPTETVEATMSLTLAP